MINQVEKIIRNFKVLSDHCAERGMRTEGRYVNIAFARNPDGKWWGVSVYENGTWRSVNLHDRNKLLMWHEAVDVLHGRNAA